MGIGGIVTGPLRAANAGFDMLSRPGAITQAPLMHTGTVLGAAGGAAYGAGTSPEDPATGTAVGGAAGAAIGGAAPVAAGMGVGAIGEGAAGAARNIDAIGGGMIGAGKGAAQMGAGALFGAQVGRGGAMGRAASSALNPVGRWTGAAGRALGGLVEPDHGRSLRINRKGGITTMFGGIFRDPTPFRITAAGAGVFMTGAAIGGARGGWNEFARSRMGQMDRQITRATPEVPGAEGGGAPQMPPDNAGATGDLVFAMNANRRG